MQIWPQNISNRKVKHESHGDVIGKYPAYLETMSKAVTIGDSMVNRIVFEGC